jgi:uncharacterized membrane protein YjfL (UPF0719 family)
MTNRTWEYQRRNVITFLVIAALVAVAGYFLLGPLTMFALVVSLAVLGMSLVILFDKYLTPQYETFLRIGMGNVAVAIAFVGICLLVGLCVLAGALALSAAP